MAKATIRFVGLVLLIPQLSSILWWLRTYSSFEFRGWLNVEYFLLLAVTLIFPSWPMLTLLLVELTASLIEPVAHLYYFSPADAISSLRYLSLLPAWRLVGYSGLLATYMIICIVALRFCLHTEDRTRNRTFAVIVLVISLSAVIGDLATGVYARFHLTMTSRASDSVGLRLVRAPILSLIRNLLVVHSEKIRPAIPMHSALSLAVNDQILKDHDNVVLILVESWGVARDPRLDSSQVAPYQAAAILRRYDVKAGHVPFRGATTMGETRELCSDSRGRGPDVVPAGSLNDCWPKKLADLGYSTLAIHGFTPTMFHRQQWYEGFGFQHAYFLPELEQDGVSLCNGAFPGACDVSVAAWIGAYLTEAKSDKPMFIHWVTLNSHLPLPPVTTDEINAYCAPLNIEHDTDLCAWYTLVHRVQLSVQEIALLPGLERTEFVIVGDHAPPFLRSDLRALFSQTDVPYVILSPR